MSLHDILIWKHTSNVKQLLPAYTQLVSVTTSQNYLYEAILRMFDSCIGMNIPTYTDPKQNPTGKDISHFIMVSFFFSQNITGRVQTI